MGVCLKLLVLAIVAMSSHCAQAEPSCFSTGQQSDPALSCQVLAVLGYLSGEFWVLASDGFTPVQVNCHMSGTLQNPIGVARFGRQVFQQSTTLEVNTWASGGSYTQAELNTLVDYELVTDSEFAKMQQLGGNVTVDTDMSIKFGEDDSMAADSFLAVRFQDSLSAKRIVRLANWTLAPVQNAQNVQDITVVRGERLSCTHDETGDDGLTGCGTPWSPNTPLPGQESPLLVVQRVHFRPNCCKTPNIVYRDAGGVSVGSDYVDVAQAAASCTPGCFALTGTLPTTGGGIRNPDAFPMWHRNNYLFQGTAYFVDVTVNDTAATSSCQTELRESGCAQLTAFQESGRFNSWFSARRVTLDVLCATTKE